MSHDNCVVCDTRKPLVFLLYDDKLEPLCTECWIWWIKMEEINNERLSEKDMDYVMKAGEA